MLDHTVVVDEEDAVVDVLEHPSMPFEREPLLLDLAVEGPQLDRPLERGDEVVAVDRLLDEVVSAAAQRLHRELTLPVPGDHQCRRRRAELADLMQQREPVHARHLDVADDGVVVGLLDSLEGVDGRLGRIDLNSVHPQPERFGERVEQRPVVVDEQDPRVHSSGSSGGCSSAKGSSITNVAPLPGRLVTEMSPAYSRRML